MRSFFGWWYTVALPNRPPSSTPMEREQERYSRLTAGLLLLIICVFLPLSIIMIFFSKTSPSARPSAFCIAFLLIIAWLAGRLARQRLSASCIIACTFVALMGPLLTDPLTAALVPLFSIFTISVILAGALMPPVAALVTGAISCLAIGLVAIFSLNTVAYNQGSEMQYQAINTLSIAIFLPIIVQIVVSIIVYVIMRNLLSVIRRADRAEEIVALQTEIADHEEERYREQQQLEDGLEKIAAAHARIANGDYQARVSLNEGDVLWSIAVPLNNLLNRLQTWKNDADTLRITNQAAAYIAEQIRAIHRSGQARDLPLTKTPLDPVIVEVNKVIANQSQYSRASKPL